MRPAWTRKGVAAALAVSTAALGFVIAAPAAQAESAVPDFERVDGPSVPVSTTGSYVVILRADPLLGSFEQDELRSSRAERAAEEMKRGHAKIMERAGVHPSKKVSDFVNAVNGFSAVISHDEAEAIALQKDVAFVVPDELRQLATDESGTFLGLNAPGGAWDTGLTGEDVVVGVIDSGIWPEHPSLIDDGSYSDLGIVLDESEFPACDFGGDESHLAAGLSDPAFECNDKLIGARHVMPMYLQNPGVSPIEYDSARDENGHGTHTATTAAGNAGVAASVSGVDRGLVSGVAPRARVIAYKALGELGGYGSDLALAIDTAVADGVDVINYSIGSSSFAIGPDDVAFLFAADAGVHVATSNGNAGPGAATTGSPASVPWLTSVGASTHSRTFQGSVTLGDGETYFGASITNGTGELPLVDAADAGSELCIPGELDAAVVTDKIVLCKRGDIARVDKSLAVALAGGAGMVLYNTFDADSLVTDNHWVPSVHVNFTDGSAIKGYIASTADPVATIEGGVYTSIDAPWMAAFSSRGENRLSSDIIKPDVTAPGVNILAGNTPTPTTGSPGELFQSISGTSMSSPHVAGLFALIDQAHPGWSPSIAKSALMTTAYQDVMKEDGTTPADPFDMGAGHVDPSGSPAAKNSIFNPGIAYDAGWFEYLGFTCGADLGLLSSASCDFLAANGVATDPSDFNQASIGVGALAGSQTVTRTLTNVSGKTLSLRADVDVPDGYAVDVTPKTIVVPKNGTATIEITITNVSAPVGEWRFGSMTLRELGNGRSKAEAPGGYSAYSPIAVRGVQIAVPSEVAGTGESGSASFEVSFGYTGDYAAAAHGLEPATVVSDNVVQDPDQAFDPNDGFSNVHTVDVSGAALLRFAMPPDATEAGADLDLFLVDPNGDLVAASTNGGTDELIDIVLPMDGTWSLYVHGWLTIDGDSDYDLYSWVVSATPGGNLSIDSAPASATLGTTGTVDVSWSGATAGQWHLGAVSHTGDAWLGLTLIDVDNR